MDPNTLVTDPLDALSIASTVEDFLEDCLVNGFSPRTVECYRSSLRTWQSFLSQRGISSLPEITREILLEYRHYLHGVYRSNEEKPIGSSTQAQKLAAVRSYFCFCVRIGKMLHNGAEQLCNPKLPKPLPRGILSKQQMKKLLSLPDTTTVIGFRDRVILELFYSTGIRRKELAGIKLEDCYLNDRRMFIREGKGSYQRWVPLGKKVRDILCEYLKEIRPRLVKHRTHDTLVVGDRGKAINHSRIHRIVSGYLKQLKVKSDCHGLRHTCATHLLKGKANIRVIQSLLGHSSLATTQIYTHVDISDITKAIEKAHPRENMLCDEF